MSGCVPYSVEKKKEVYTWIKMVGFVSFIPLVLASGPFGGYIVGTYLKKRFQLDDRTVTLCIVLGLAASLLETVEIIKRVRRMDREP